MTSSVEATAVSELRIHVSNSGGDIWTVNYSDDTPGLTNSCDRRGRLASVSVGLWP